MYLTSSAFRSDDTASRGGSTIPAEYAMRAVPGGRNTSIPYAWGDAPAETKSFALTLVDTAPIAHDWVHWAVVDIPESVAALAQGASGTPEMPEGAIELRNTFGVKGYGGPQPPAGTGPHTYVATLYALDVPHVEAGPAPSAAELERALAGHVIASATSLGRFGR
jgi:Raf kinase inhibitor-like YbhB/YbcL family protein